MPYAQCVAHRALQNPALFTSQIYKQAAAAVIVGLAIRLIVAIPVRFPPLPSYSKSL